MKIKKQKVMAIFLTICLLIGILPSNALAYGETGTFDATGGTVTYKVLEDETVAITGCKDTVTEIVIPDEIDGKTVTTIAGEAFRYNETLVYVKFPAHLTTIELYAFSGCIALETADFSACTEAVSLGDSAFSGAILLKEVAFPAGVSDMQELAFASCHSLSKVDISKSTALTVIPAYAFENAAFTEFTVPDCVTRIDNCAFRWCEKLTDLSLGQGVQSIGEEAFASCPISSLVLPDSVTDIGFKAFDSCTSLTDITWPSNKNFMTVAGFTNCTALPVSELNEALTLPSVSAIGDYAFTNCNFDQVTIPANIRNIGESAFSGNLNMTSLTIFPGVEQIRRWAFENCTGLARRTVVIPETVTELRSGAFAGCKKQNDDTTFTGITVEVRNRDFGLTPWNEDSRETVDIDGQTYENPFPDFTNIRTYETNSAGNPTMLKQFYDTQKDAQYNAQNLYIFEPLESSASFYTVSGTVPAGGKVEMYVNEKETPVTLTDNHFEVKADAGAKVTAEILLDGYYSKHFIKTELNTDWDLGEIAFTEGDRLPVNQVLRVDFGEAKISSFRNLELTLKAGERILTEGTDYTLQYPNIVLADTVTEDCFTLTVSADQAGYTGGSAAARREDGIFSLLMTQWGSLEITTESEFAGDNHILVFDVSGSLVGKSRMPKNGFYRTGSLKAGTYTILAYNANESFAEVASMDVLAKMGLNEGRDYVKITAEVADGSENEIKVTIPLLKADVAGILDKSQCSVVVEHDEVVAGQNHVVRVYYGFADGEEGSLSILLPEDSTLNYICTSTTQLSTADYKKNGNIVTISSVGQKGMYYILLSNSKEGIHDISAAATVGNTTAPVGSASYTVGKLSIHPAARITNKRTGNSVTVKAAPETEVSLYLEGMIAKEGKTNKLGSVTFTYEFPESAVTGQTFKLTAKSGGVEASAEVFYEMTASGLETWNFYQTNRLGKPYNGAYLYRAENGFQPPSFYYYLFNEKADNDWTIGATFVGKTEPENVVTYVKTLDGKVKLVSMTLLNKKELPDGKGYHYTFAGEMTLPCDEDGVISEGQIPEEFAIDWENQGETYTYDAEAAARIDEKAAANALDREDAVTASMDKLHISEELNQWIGKAENPSEYIFGAKYRVSESDWFKGLPEDVQSAAYNLEKAIDNVTVAYSEAYGLEKNLTEYGSWEEVYKELGFTFGKNTRSADELRAEGYTVLEQDGKFTAYKDYTELAETKTSRKAAARDAAVGGVTGGFTFVDGNGNQVDFVGNAQGNTQQAINNFNYGQLTDAYDDFADAITKHPDCGALEAGMLGGVGAGMHVAGDLATIDNIRQDAEAMVDFTEKTAEMEGYIEELKLYENRYANQPLCSNSIMRERFIAMDIRLLLDNEAFRSEANAIAGSVLYTAGYIDKTGFSDSVGVVWDAATNTVGERRAAQIQKLLEDLDRQTRVRKQQCDDTDMEDLMRKTHKSSRVKPVMDPSGIVYEAVESNTVSGVTATVWYAEDAQGTNAQVWDAENYEQINPQITDNSGMFAWDVPIGWWQVRFEKEGYESTATEWMQVPPPRIGLKIAMKSTEKPVVSSVGAYPDYIEVIFSQYMDTEKEIILPAGMTGMWQSVDSGYSKVLHITKAGGFQKGSKVSFTLDGAQNYTGKALAFYNSGELTVSARPAELILDYESVIFAKAGTEKEITVRVKDSEGNYMEGVTVEAEFGNTLIAALYSGSEVTDAEGKTVFTANALLPGYTDITFRAAGTSLEKTLTFRAALEERRPKRPTAAIGETQFGENSPKENYITVKGGEQLVISAEDGVTIYYTTDDTCPCQNSSSRKIYTNPIPITENTKFRIAAYKDGMDYSERLNITVTVDDTHQHSYGCEWKSDENGHWHECSCGAVSDRAEHDWKVENAKDATATESGYTGDKTCKVCGYEVKGEKIPATGTTKPTEPTNPGDDNTTNPVNPDRDKPTNPNGDGNENTNSPQTGDNNNLWLWFAVLFISGGILIGTSAYSKKKKYSK